ncbi:hypothetical protein [Streptosporangium sp. NPDC049078]|uniref:hypothetical protein n=1 Tax=Streptosporangium sp. NPDC049078 TaxID=3155767 RepID=UPI0034232E76
MVASGWAATFLIYPSLPSTADLTLLVADAETAWAEKRGVWAQFGEDLLLGYEYRACIKLGARDLPDGPAATIGQAFQRVCVDLRTLAEVGLYGYHQVPPRSGCGSGPPIWTRPAATCPSLPDLTHLGRNRPLPTWAGGSGWFWRRRFGYWVRRRRAGFGGDGRPWGLGLGHSSRNGSRERP